LKLASSPGCSTSNHPALTRRVGDHGMKKPIMRADFATAAAEASSQLFDDWFDPIESGVRSRVRDFIETMMEEELDAVLSRRRFIAADRDPPYEL
jgi:hypothetical protein